MRKDIQAIFKHTPRSKQVMMFSATLSQEMQRVCRKFMSDVTAPPRHSRHSSSTPSLSKPLSQVWRRPHPRILYGCATLQPVMEVIIDDQSRLTLDGIQQHYAKLSENEKNRKLTMLLDALQFNQVNRL